MKTATITKTMNLVNKTIELSKTDNFYKASLGFHRISALPARIRKSINLACILKGESNDHSMREFLNNLTEQEFVNWLKLA